MKFDSMLCIFLGRVGGLLKRGPAELQKPRFASALRVCWRHSLYLFIKMGLHSSNSPRNELIGDISTDFAITITDREDVRHVGLFTSRNRIRTRRFSKPL